MGVEGRSVLRGAPCACQGVEGRSVLRGAPCAGRATRRALRCADRSPPIGSRDAATCAATAPRTPLRRKRCTSLAAPSASPRLRGYIRVTPPACGVTQESRL
eukprot:1184410-Prorocentrum_minimum.AAC.6